MKLRVSVMIARMAGAFATCGVCSAAYAHHSYAMFDGSKTVTVSGTVAKLEWTNPHVFIWVYVPSSGNHGKYDLYAFENGSPNLLELNGWTATVLKAGDAITVDYAPLRDGRKGGHWISGKLADGTTLKGIGGPARVPANAPPPPPGVQSASPHGQRQGQ